MNFDDLRRIETELDNAPQYHQAEIRGTVGELLSLVTDAIMGCERCTGCRFLEESGGVWRCKSWERDFRIDESPANGHCHRWEERDDG